MFNIFSKTQTANYVAFIMFVIQLLNLNVSENEVSTVVSGLVGITAVLIAFYERYKKGDLTSIGFRK